MRLLDYCFDTRMTTSVPIGMHHYCLRCVPSDSDVQRVVSWQLELQPQGHQTWHRDGFGNLLMSGDCLETHSTFRFVSRGRVEVDLSRRAPQTVHPAFRLSSPLTRPDGALTEFSASLCLPDDPEQRAQALSDAVSARMVYAPGTTSVATTAAQAFAAGQGVCQDYAHILLTLCRMNGLAARYCCGMPLGEGATHAWVEVALPQGWVGFDPTRGKRADEGYIRLAVGRDYRDCPVQQGTFVGNADQTQLVHLTVRDAGPLQQARPCAQTLIIPQF